jgi:hypothetical protein
LAIKILKYLNMNNLGNENRISDYTGCP